MPDIQHKERLIRFNDDMARAIVEGRKTVTRRVIKPQPDTTEEWLRNNGAWVEGLTLSQHLNNAWRAGFIPVECPYGEPGDRRVAQGAGDIEITDVRIERLQDISRGDAMDEGCPFPNMAKGPDPRQWFTELWDEINGAGSWAATPWVWVVEFKRVLP